MAHGPEHGVDAVLIPITIDKEGSTRVTDEIDAITSQSQTRLAFALELEIKTRLSPRDEFIALSKLSAYISHPAYLNYNQCPIIVVNNVHLLSHPSFAIRRIIEYVKESSYSKPPILLGVRDTPADRKEDPQGPNDLCGYLENAWRCVPCIHRNGMYDYDSFLYHAHYRKSEYHIIIPAVLALTPNDESMFSHASSNSYIKWIELSCAWIDIWCNGSNDAFIVIQSWAGHLRWGQRSSSLTVSSGQLGHQSFNTKKFKPAANTYSRATQIFRLGKTGGARMAIFIHGFYLGTLRGILEYLALKDSVQYDVYLSTPRNAMQRAEQMLRRFNVKNAVIFGVENEGRDIAPFVQHQLPCALEDGHQYFLKIHTKKSHHLDDPGEDWAQSLYESLLRPESLLILHRYLQHHESVGIAAPPGSLLPTSVCLARNSSHLLTLLRMTKIDGPWFLRQKFVAGSMFAGRIQALRTVISLIPELPTFEHETGQTDGTLAHALERMMCVFALKSGYDISQVMSLKGIKQPSFGFEFAKPLPNATGVLR